MSLLTPRWDMLWRAVEDSGGLDLNKGYFVPHSGACVHRAEVNGEAGSSSALKRLHWGLLAHP